jgi:hypothetical protein
VSHIKFLSHFTFNWLMENKIFTEISSSSVSAAIQFGMLSLYVLC